MFQPYVFRVSSATYLKLHGVCRSSRFGMREMRIVSFSSKMKSIENFKRVNTDIDDHIEIAVSKIKEKS